MLGALALVRVGLDPPLPFPLPLAVLGLRKFVGECERLSLGGKAYAGGGDRCGASSVRTMPPTADELAEEAIELIVEDAGSLDEDACRGLCVSDNEAVVVARCLPL